MRWWTIEVAALTSMGISVPAMLMVFMMSSFHLVQLKEKRDAGERPSSWVSYALVLGRVGREKVVRMVS